MNKRQLAAKLAKRTGLNGSESLKLINCIIFLIKEALADGDDVRLAGLCRFYLKYNPEEIRRDRFNNEDYESPEWYQARCSVYGTTDLYINGRLLDFDKDSPTELNPVSLI